MTWGMMIQGQRVVLSGWAWVFLIVSGLFCMLSLFALVWKSWDATGDP